MVVEALRDRAAGPDLGWRANWPAVVVWLVTIAVVAGAAVAWGSAPSADQLPAALSFAGFGLLAVCWFPWAFVGRLARWACAVGAAANAAAVVRLVVERGLDGARLSGQLVFGVIYLLVAVGLILASWRSGDGLEPVWLLSPFDRGEFIVIQGGPRVLNHHRRVPAQRHALDLVGVRWLGLRTRSFVPRSLEDFRSFGASILCPVEGAVVQADDGYADDGPTKPAGGNCVVIATAGQRTVLVTLCHLREGSVAVRKGDHVKPGQYLGAVGSSGNSTEPHLHVHATDLEGKGLPLRLGRDRPLWRNRTVGPQASVVDRRRVDHAERGSGVGVRESFRGSA